MLPKGEMTARTFSEPALPGEGDGQDRKTQDPLEWGMKTSSRRPRSAPAPSSAKQPSSDSRERDAPEAVVRSPRLQREIYRKRSRRAPCVALNLKETNSLPIRLRDLDELPFFARRRLEMAGQKINDVPEVI